MGISVWSQDETPLPTLHIDEYIQESMRAFDALLPKPEYTIVETPSRKFAVKPNELVFMGAKTGNEWPKFCRLNKAFHDIVKKKGKL